MEKKTENEMETGIIRVIIGIMLNSSFHFTFHYPNIYPIYTQYNPTIIPILP